MTIPIEQAEGEAQSDQYNASVEDAYANTQSKVVAQNREEVSQSVRARDRVELVDEAPFSDEELSKAMKVGIQFIDPFRDLAQSMANLSIDVAETGANLVLPEEKEIDLQPVKAKIQLPDAPPPEGALETTAAITGEIASFAAPFAGWLKAVKAIGLTGRVAAYSATAATTFTRYDEHERNLADFLKNVPELGPALSFLQKDEDDGPLEARAKNAAADVLGGAVGDVIFKSVKYLRSVRKAAKKTKVIKKDLRVAGKSQEALNTKVKKVDESVKKTKKNLDKLSKEQADTLKTPPTTRVPLVEQAEQAAKAKVDPKSFDSETIRNQFNKLEQLKDESIDSLSEQAKQYAALAEAGDAVAVDEFFDVAFKQYADNVNVVKNHQSEVGRVLGNLGHSEATQLDKKVQKLLGQADTMSKETLLKKIKNLKGEEIVKATKGTKKPSKLVKALQTVRDRADGLSKEELIEELAGLRQIKALKPKVFKDGLADIFKQVDTADKAKILQKVDFLLNNPDLSKSQKEIALAHLSEFSNATGIAKVDDYLNSIHIQSTLSGYQTIAANTAQGPVGLAFTSFERFVSGGVGSARKLFAKNADMDDFDQVFAEESWIRLGAMANTIGDGFKLMANSFKATSDDVFSKRVSKTFGTVKKEFKKSRVDLKTKFDDSRDHVSRWLPVDLSQKVSAESFNLDSPDLPLGRFLNFAGKTLEGMNQFSPGNILQGVDDVTKTLSYRGDMYASAYRQAKKKGLKGVARQDFIDTFLHDPEKLGAHMKHVNNSLQQDAVRRANEMTLTEDLGPIAQKMHDAVRATGFGKYIFRFVRTTNNSMKQFMLRTPAALTPKFKLPGTDIVMNQAFWDDIAAGGSRADMAIGRVASGTALLTLGFYLAEQKIVKGDISFYNRAKREEALNVNVKPRSLEIHGKQYDISRFDPVSSLFLYPAYVAEIVDDFGDELTPDEDKDLGDVVALTGLAASKLFLTKSFTQQPVQLIEAITAKDEKRIQGFMGQFAAGFVPNWYRDAVANEIDPLMREADGIMGRVVNKLGYGTIPKFTIFGETILKDKGREYTKDPGYLELFRVGAAISKPSRRIRGVLLEPKEYEIFMDLVASTGVKDRIASEIEKDYYQQMEPATQRDWLKKIYSDSVSAVRNQVLGDPMFTNLHERIMARQLHDARANKQTTFSRKLFESRITTGGQ